MLRSDVAIIGGGIVGLAIARRLHLLGLSVTVFDAGAIAGEASSAGAGMLAPGGEVKAPAKWAVDTVAALRQYGAFVDELSAASGMEIDFRRCGGLDLAFDEDRWAVLLARKAVQAQMGIAAEEIPAARAREFAPMLIDGEFRALWYPEDAIVDPRDVTAALVRVLRAANVPLAAGVRVARCERAGDCLLALDGFGETVAEARAIVVAAGAWASEIGLAGVLDPAAPPPRKAMPVRGHLVRATREPQLLGPIVRAEELYVFQRNQGDVLAGSNEERVGFSRDLNLPAVHRLQHLAEKLLPGLLPRVESAWLGFRPGIEGDGPEVRRVGESAVWLAYGHFRNGILLAPHTADVISSEIGAALG